MRRFLSYFCKYVGTTLLMLGLIAAIVSCNQVQPAADVSQSTGHAGTTDSTDHAGMTDPTDHAGTTDPTDHAGMPDPTDHAGTTDPTDHAGMTEHVGTAGITHSDQLHTLYSDLTLNILDLRSRVAMWKSGDAGSLNIAFEKLERIEAVLKHSPWPPNMEMAIARTRSALPPISTALTDKNSAAAQAAAEELGKAALQVTDAFNSPGMNSSDTSEAADHSSGPEENAVTASSDHGTGGHSQSHSDDEGAAVQPNPTRNPILAGFAAVNTAVIAAAVILKHRTPKKVRARPVTPGTKVNGGPTK